MKRKIDFNSVKKQNRLLVLNEIIQHDHLTRSEIARSLDLSNATVGTIADEMIHLGIIIEEKDMTSSIGRKPSLLRINKDANLIMVLDLATKAINYSLLDLELNILDTRSHTYDNTITYQENLDSFLLDTKSWLTSSQMDKIIGIGVSVPGTYQHDTDAVLCTIVPELTGINLHSIIAKHFPQSIFIENDMRFLALKDIQKVVDYKHKSIFFMCLGSGIGGALCVNGHIYTGANNFAGEIGQTLLTSGQTVEHAIAWDDFIQNLKRLFPDTAEDALHGAVMNAYAEDHPHVTEAIHRLTDLIAVPLTNMIWLLNPDTIVISDQYGIFDQIFIDRIRENITKHIPKGLLGEVEIMHIKNKSKSVILGAAHVIRRKWLEQLSAQ